MSADKINFNVSLRWMFLSVILLGCDTDLDTAYDEYRDQAPAVCKDYCEEKVACERPLGGGLNDDDAFASQVHFCVVECAAYAAEGAYVWTEGIAALGVERSYDGHLDGTVLMDAFDCLYDLGSYRCVQNGTEDYSHKFNPPTRTVCEEANNCVSDFGIAYSFFWTASPDGIGGTCYISAEQSIESIFF